MTDKRQQRSTTDQPGRSPSSPGTRQAMGPRPTGNTSRGASSQGGSASNQGRSAGSQGRSAGSQNAGGRSQSGSVNRTGSTSNPARPSQGEASRTGKPRFGAAGKASGSANRRPAAGGRPRGAANAKASAAAAAGQQRSDPARQAKPKPQSAREVALRVLTRVDEQGAYSGLALNRTLEEANLSKADAGLATEIVYGTIQRKLTIDHVLESRVKGWPAKVEPWVRSLLRMSYYQLRWLDRVPAHAVTDEAVRLAKKRGHGGIAGLVNGVLRSLLREGSLTLALPSGLSAGERISLTHSYPLWLVQRWIAAYGEAGAEAICAASNEAPHASGRVNPLRVTREELLAKMGGAGLDARPSPLAPNGIVALRSGSLASTPWFNEGLLSVQDESSMLVAAVCDPKPGMRVLDCCAAPGGKATQLAELMQDQGEVVANDVHSHKEELIRQQANRLGLTSLSTMVGDAAELPLHMDPSSMDVVLLDAPCSGLGVIRRKPEIKWNKTEGDIKELSALQGRLIVAASQLVKPGGTLVYSTCTIAPEENEDTVRRFLAGHRDFELDPSWPEQVLEPLRSADLLPASFEGMFQLLPQHFGSDGFFIARLRRKQQS